ncbi:helicase-associated domain-containing protein [Thermomonospora umbrina]|uniref:XPB/Ssl2-like helicase family protein n=1 Tax=Thermomonospora umbrina TaxID=111806 RepID=A0A3D9TAB2_9ACTN|nr:helicase-associated domain-containing protein [Thermomonospora umbrina]REF00712.1 XPB/Ssl2-like helicase family protein [Thermomonospora umbrina]
MTGTPLRDRLAALEQHALAEVLAARADVCGPTEPGGWNDLAHRLEQRPSVERALGRLTRPSLQVAKIAAQLGRNATRESITTVLGGPGAAVDEALTALERHALVWPGHGGVLDVAGPLRERWPTPSEVLWSAPFDPFPPRLPTVPVDRERVEATAAARLGEFVGHAAKTLIECARLPLHVFKTAGLQPRALRRVRDAAGCDEASARLVLACAKRAGLFVVDGERLGLSPGGDAFTHLPPGEQAARLLSAWWLLESAPTRTRSDDGGRLHPLSAKAACDGCAEVRHELISVLREVPEGQGVHAPKDLAGALGWRRPLACDHRPHGPLTREAVLLGLVAHGALSSFGAFLAAGDHAGLVRRASQLLPAFSEHATIGPGFMVTVRGTPSRRLAKELDAVADGFVGPVWRIGDDSLRRALESGLGAADIEARLAANSAEPLPPSLRSKIAKVAGGHVPPPRLREVPATCVFHGTDHELLARAARHPALQGLGVRLLSPGVLIATGPRESVLAALRAAGYHATAEDPGPGPLPPPPSQEPPPDFDALAERLRRRPHVPPRSPARTRPAGPRAATRSSPRRTPLERWLRIVTRQCPDLDSDEMRQLAEAIAEDERVRIAYVDQNGVETDRVIAPPYEPVRINRKRLLKAVCELRSAQTGRREERNFHFSRIQSVRTVDD